jgi:sugar lactone lactonase YvrE
MGYLVRLAFIIGAAALFVGCGGSQPPIGAPGPGTRSLFDYRTRQFVAPAMGTRPESIGSPSYKMSDSLLHVVNIGANSYPLGDVAIYDARAKNPKPIAIITDGIDQPGGDCIDATGTLYVTNTSGNVAEYAPGKTKPLRYITQGRGTPAACTIDSNGNLWVAALFDVIEYLKGSNQPHKLIENGVTYANSVVFDHAGNMYVGNLGDPYYHLPYNVQVYAPGRKAPSRTITDGITWPVGTAVDADNTLYVTNDNAPCNVEEYRVGQNHPFRTITDEIDGPTALTFDESGRLYEANGGTQGCTSDGPYAVILEFRHGSVKPSRRTISTRLYPSGIAYYPPQLP